jgi:hypothetical protein
MKSDNGIYVVFGIAIIGLAGYWAYNKYLKPKVDSVVNTSKFFGILK